MTDRTKRKLAKLLALANDTRGNEHERATAARQATLLVRRHGREVHVTTDAPIARPGWVTMLLSVVEQHVGDVRSERAVKIINHLVEAMQREQVADGITQGERKEYRLSLVYCIGQRFKSIRDGGASPCDFTVISQPSFNVSLRGRLAGYRIDLEGL
jgi:hypothetical protein